MKKPSLKLNFIMNALLTLSNFLFPLITYPYISRVLLPEGIGKISFATSLIAYFSIFAQLGIPTYGIRACAKVRDDKTKLTRTAHELLMINLIMNVITYAVFFLSLAFVPKLQEEKLLYVIVSSTILLTSIGMEWLYKALEKYTYITVRSVAFKLIAFVLMFTLVHEEDDYIIYGALTILAASASNILNFVNAHKYIGFKSVGAYDLKRHIAPVMVFFAMACSTTIYTHLDTVMLGFMTTDKDVGYYYTSVRVKTILVSIVTSLGAVLLPRLSYYIEHDMKEDFITVTEKALKFVFLFATPLSVYFIIYAKYGVYVLSGRAFEGAILPMQIMMPTLLLIGITNLTGIQVLVPLGEEKKVLYSVVIGAVVDVVINFLLIPRMVSSGAAIGTLIAEIVVLLVQFYYIDNNVRLLFKKVPYIKLGLAIGFAAAASISVSLLKLGDLLTLVLSSAVFFSVYLIFLFLTREELTISILGQIKRRLLNVK